MAAAYLRMCFVKRATLREEAIRRRELRDLSNPLNIPEKLFIADYRLSQDVFVALCDQLRVILPVRKRSTGVPLELKVLTTLSFLATGSYQKSVGNDQHSQKSVSRQMNEVVLGLNQIMHQHIKFPGTEEERNATKLGFYEKFQFPCVIGCIDGMHIAIIKPQVHDEIYFNRNGFHSMNALMICDSNLKILAICAKHVGGSQDAHIWKMMAIKPYIEEIRKQETLWLLGDSAFPLSPYMMTPILDAVPGSPEHNYTRLHCTVRSCTERCFGVLKARWRCLLNNRVLHYTPKMAVKIANACAVLHNIAIAAQMPHPDLLIEENDVREMAEDDFGEMGEEDDMDENDDLRQGQIVQRELVETLWNYHQI